MLPAERQIKIINIVNEQGAVSVEDLAETLAVSPMTIRRDLEKLGRSGLLSRTHGGAVPVGFISNEENYDQKTVYNKKAKADIAKVGAGLINEGDSIFLDAGTTTYEIGLLLKDYTSLTVVTNDLKIALSLLDTQVKLILCGGTVQNVTGSTLGHLAEEVLNNIKVNKSFIGTSCINEGFDLMTPTLEKAFIKRAGINIASKSYLLADDNKFYHQALFKVVNLSKFTGIITNKQFSEHEMQSLATLDIEIIKA